MSAGICGERGGDFWRQAGWQILEKTPPFFAARYGTARGWQVMLRCMLSDAQRHFLDAGRVAHLATADGHGAPHVVPVCYAVAGASLYVTIDEKPKRQDVPLKRLR